MPRCPSHRYTHGHHDSVLASHRSRTAANSAAYLLPRLEHGQRLLDVGCGPGTITADLAEMVDPGEVVALDRESWVLDEVDRVSSGVASTTSPRPSVTSTPSTSRTACSMSSMPTRCCNTSPTRWLPSARCVA